LSDQIQKRRDEALRLLREKAILLPQIGQLKDETKVLSRLLLKAWNGEHVEKGDLSPFGLEETSAFLLKLRLQGLLDEKKRALDSLNLRQRNMHESLRLLEVCPSCEGQGILSRRHYERSEGFVSVSGKSETCALCHGTGKIFLGDEIRRIMEM